MLRQGQEPEYALPEAKLFGHRDIWQKQHHLIVQQEAYNFLPPKVMN